MNTRLPLYWLAALLAGCSLAPKYEPPAAPAIAAFREAGDWITAQPADDVSRGAWWTAFADPALDDLQRQVDAGNQDYRAALARLEQARAIAGVSRSDLFPTLQIAAGVQRESTSANAPASVGRSVTYNDFNASLGLSWEIDLFGRLRNAAAAAGHRAQASAADLAAIELAVRAQLAGEYFALRGADAILRLLDDTIAAYDRTHELLRNRYDSGVAAATDVDQADTQRQNARAQRAAMARERAEHEHAIAVLVGRLPADLTLPAAATVATPPSTPLVLASTLLQRRPDVAGAERRMAAANAEIGVARAAWFPVFSVGASGGYRATQTSMLFDAPSRFWSIGPDAALSLLDVGGRSARTRFARAAYDEALAGYRQTTLVAYREVEDSLAALRELAGELAADEAAASSAQRSVAHAQSRYTAGIADYLEVASTQTAALEAQRAALLVRVQSLTQTVQLMRAMGGGFAP